jgi:hypothetical protein
MSDKIKPANMAAQLHYRGAGNPFSVLPRTAISNCFPGLEFDFRNVWRRAIEGIVLVENNNYVVAAESPAYEHLVGHRLLSIDGLPTMVVTTGPISPGGDSQRLGTTANPNAVSFMEWSNSIARLVDKQGLQVECRFTAMPSTTEVIASEQKEQLVLTMTLRKFFEGDSAAFAAGLVQPGELTQGLCAPWQNDYRECACYYWAASRPDYVNVEPTADGLSRGDMWLSKERTGTYVPDNRTDPRLLSYDDLFADWQRQLHFIIGGKDADAS